MQIFVCEGCEHREKPCIAVDQIDECGYPDTCIYAVNMKGDKLKRNWKKIDAADLAVVMFNKIFQALLKS